MKISNFYMSEYVDASSYECLRKIASVTDGLKNSGRKVVATILDKNMKNTMKVSRLKSTVAEYTEYLHGEDGLADVIVNLARRYPGTNNLPLFVEDGNFGKRFIPEASADRYIATAAEEYLKYIFPKEDREILIKQEFEGVQIEPRYFIPVIPMLLVNGSPSAISIGFAQIILPRPVNQIIKMTEEYIDTGKVKVPKPGWAGFKGKVVQDKENKRKWIVYGKFSVINTTTIEITEVPVGYSLKKYQNVLDTLKENKVITSYQDKSENNQFLFKVRVSRKFTEMSQDQIASALHLRDNDKRFVENYTSMGSDNRILLSETPEDLFYEYAKIREEYYIKRKASLIEQTTKDIRFLASKAIFIKNVVEDKVVVNKRSRVEIIDQIKGIKGIISVDGNYDYLLRSPIYSLTSEKIDELMKQVKDKKLLLDEYKNKEPKTFWKEDIQILKSHL